MRVEVRLADGAQPVAYLQRLESFKPDVFGYEIPSIRSIYAFRTAAAGAHRNDAPAKICVAVGSVNVSMGALHKQGVGHQEPVAALKEINLHSKPSGVLRARTFIGLFPDQSGLGDSLKSSHVNRLEHLWDSIEEVGADCGLARQLRGAVRFSEEVPGWIGIDNSVFGIQKKANLRTLVEHSDHAVQFRAACVSGFA